MADFYWIGGSTGTTGSYTNPLGNFSGITGTANMDWVLAFDFNNPANWVEQIWIPFDPYVLYAPTRRSPGPGDSVIFGADGQATNAIEGLPRAKAPCLWGGASAAGATVTWFGGGDGGSNSATTSNNAIAAFTVDKNWRPFVSTSAYKFANIGSNGILNAAGGGEMDEYSPLYNAQSQGFTLDSNIWGFASWENLIAAVAATGAAAREKYNQLRLKVDLVEVEENVGLTAAMLNSATGGYAGKNNIGVFELNCLKNLKTIGSGSTSASYESTIALLRGNPEYRMNGYFYKIERNCGNQQSLNGTFVYSPRPSLLMTGVTATYVKVNGHLGAVSTDESTNIGTMEIFPSNDFHNISIQNKFLRSQVLIDNGNYGNTSGGNSGGSPNLYISNVPSSAIGFSGITTGRDASGTVITSPVQYTGIFVGNQNPSSAVQANEFMIGSAVPTGMNRLYLKFMGNALINKLTANKVGIGAATEMAIPDSSNVEIGELRLRDYSELNLAQVSYFNGWKFGQQVGSQIVGGIIFEDELPTVKLSQGVALWNDQLLVGSNLAGDAAGVRYGNTPSASVPSFI